MEIKSDYIANSIPNYVEERDVFGQIKPKKILKFKRKGFNSKKPPELNVNYAGFWERALASLIDITIVLFVLAILDSLFLNNQYAMDKFIIYKVMIGMITWVLYNELLDSSVYQATIGKMILKINVIDLFGKRIVLESLIKMYLNNHFNFTFWIWFTSI